MSMRGELVIPATQSSLEWELSDHGIWEVVCLCLVGLLVALCLALTELRFDQLPLLIAQYNAFG
ncbi:MAG: hypothetical protein WBE48_20920 [Xanthobacteraceae bacterium]|jgi:hypothetical protein